jgi:hypothetical protein
MLFTPEASRQKKKLRPPKNLASLKKSIDSPFAGAEKEKEVMLGTHGRKN